MTIKRIPCKQKRMLHDFFVTCNECTVREYFTYCTPKDADNRAVVAGWVQTYFETTYGTARSWLCPACVSRRPIK